MMSPTTEEPVRVNGTGGPGTPSFVLTPENTSELNKSQFSSLNDAENFEWTAGQGHVETLEVDPEPAVNGNSPTSEARLSSGINRNTWLRTSLRRSSPINQENLPNRRWGSFRHNGRRQQQQQQLGSNALASQLYRSSSFNSSGRSSTCDTADDTSMYSDASLEEDVHDLHHKFQALQQQVGVLQDAADQDNARFTRVTADNASLQARVHMLEEQLRETEMRCEERLQDEQRRTRDLISRIEREKQLQLENASIRLQSSEAECLNLKEEVARQRSQLDKFESQRQKLLDQNQDLATELSVAQDQIKTMREQENRLKRENQAQSEVIKELSAEIDRLREEARTPALPTTNPEKLRLEELHQEIAILRSEKDELQACIIHAGVESDKILAETSLAAELNVLSQDEVHQALKEQQEVNRQLRAYIEGILLNIVENHPQLLEVRRPV